MKCPQCGNLRADAGLNDMYCPNTKCVYFDAKQAARCKTDPPPGAFSWDYYYVPYRP